MQPGKKQNKTGASDFLPQPNEQTTFINTNLFYSKASKGYSFFKVIKRFSSSIFNYYICTISKPVRKKETILEHKGWKIIVFPVTQHPLFKTPLNFSCVCYLVQDGISAINFLRIWLLFQWDVILLWTPPTGLPPLWYDVISEHSLSSNTWWSGSTKQSAHHYGIMAMLKK